MKRQLNVAMWRNYGQMTYYVVQKSHLARLLLLLFVSFLLFCADLFRTLLDRGRYLELFPKELLFPILLHLCAALLISLVIYLLLFRHPYITKVTAVTVLSFLLLDYDENFQAAQGLIRAYVPGLGSSDNPAIVSTIYLISLTILASIIARLLTRYVNRHKRLNARDMSFGITVLVIYLFALPAVKFYSVYSDLVKESKQQLPLTANVAPNSNDMQRPDIYYIVLDRYASNSVLEQQFDSNNNDFQSYLSENNFYINNGAHSNYPYTAMSIASTLNAQYWNALSRNFQGADAQSAVLFHTLIQESAVVRILRQQGYRYYAIGSNYGASYRSPQAVEDEMHANKLTIFGKTKILRGIEADVFNKSIFFNFSKLQAISWWPLKSTSLANIPYIRNQLSLLKDYAQRPAGGRFIFAHILVPHDPFYFNADGSYSANSEADDTGMPIKQKYLNQISFINSQMKTIIESILKNSNNQSVILFNADEGPYPQIMNSMFLHPASFADADIVGEIATKEDMRQWSDDWLKMKFGILQAVHIPGVDEEDLAHLSSVNLFRIVLNTYLDAGLPYLPDCQFGITEGKWRTYQVEDISNRFTNSPDEQCKSM